MTSLSSLKKTLKKVVLNKGSDFEERAGIMGFLRGQKELSQKISLFLRFLKLPLRLGCYTSFMED